MIYETFGGVYARNNGYEKRGLSFIRLPSVIGDTRAEVWHLDMGFTVKDFCMDPAQDLLIVVQQRETRLAQNDVGSYLLTDILPSQTDPYLIHMKSFSTNAAHPLALCPSVEYDPGHGRQPDCMMQVMGPLLGIYFNVAMELVPGQLLIWNWKTGVLLCVSPVMYSLPQAHTIRSLYIAVNQQIRGLEQRLLVLIRRHLRHPQLSPRILDSRTTCIPVQT